MLTTLITSFHINISSYKLYHLKISPFLNYSIILFILLLLFKILND
nr:MAG TPA: hypothetical protein [Caudoviricetes sp.]